MPNVANFLDMIYKIPVQHNRHENGEIYNNNIKNVIFNVIFIYPRGVSFKMLSRQENDRLSTLRFCVLSIYSNPSLLV